MTRRAPVAPIGRAELRALFDGLVDPEAGLCAHGSRFSEAQVVEALAVWGAGRLGVTDMETLSGAFLASDRVVRLVNRDNTGRAPGQWSTVTHRRPRRPRPWLLSAFCNSGRRRRWTLCRSRPPSPGRPSWAPIRAAAVALLAGPGAGLRAVIAPAGYGKAATLAAAVDASRRAGRSVLAVSTTNQAVGQLRQVGIPATTVARFALDRKELPARLRGHRGRVLSVVHPVTPRWCWPRLRPARAGKCGWWATPSKPSRSAPAVWRYGCPKKYDRVECRRPS